MFGLRKQNCSDELLLKLGLNSREINRNVMELSGVGSMQRVAIARALCLRPCDSGGCTTGNLDDSTGQLKLYGILKNFGSRTE